MANITEYRRISFQRFKWMVKFGKWSNEHSHKVIYTNVLNDLIFPDEPQKITTIGGVIRVKSELDGVTINYTEHFKYIKSIPESIEIEYADKDKPAHSWEVIGVIIVDNIGEVSNDRISDFLSFNKYDKLGIEYFKVIEEINKE